VNLSADPATAAPPPANAAPVQGQAPVLAAADLGGQRGERALFHGLNLQLQPGQVVWLRGRNGRGKTSLLRIMAGLSSPALGAVLCNDTPLPKQSSEWRRQLVYIAQGRKHTADEILAALAVWGIAALHQAPVRTLSQGQRRRTALARLALPHPASVWLLDEPFDALDDEGVATLCSLLTAQSRRGGSVMLTSHQAVPLRDPEPVTVHLDNHAFAA
jgi:heme exporter protein A